MCLRNLAFIFLVCCLVITSSLACTETMIKAKDNAVVVGRTLEFGPSLNSQIISSPRGRQFKSIAPDNKPGISWTAKYGYLYMNFFGQNYPVDGMNEKGLSFAALYAPGITQYQIINPKQDNRALSYLSFGDWILGNFRTVAQVKQALAKVKVFAQPLSFPNHPNVVFPLHIMVTDRSGNSIVIEFIKGKMKIYNAKLGIMTNSPNYNWQITNLSNYANLSPYSPKPVIIDGYSYTANSQGSGMHGLPGDTTSPSRFVKTTFLTKSAFPVANAMDAVVLVNHILNTVDIPNGMVRGEKGSGKSGVEITQWTVIKDLKNNTLYFRSYTNPQWQYIKMNKVNLTKGAPQFKMTLVSRPMMINATQRFLRHVTIKNQDKG